MGENFDIRQAGREDIARLAALADHVFRHAYSFALLPGDLEAHIERFLSAASFVQALERCVILVAERNRQMVGFTQFGPTREETAGPDDRELIRLYVHPGHQNQKIGSSLLQAALDHSTMAAAPRVFVEVWEKNQGALRLYERFGFEPFGARKFEVASGAPTDLDLVLVRRQPGGSMN